MVGFFAELKRRHIYRVAAAYAVVAWVLIQLVSNVSPMLRLPDWAGTFVLVLLFVGFPVALLFAWIHQLAPESGALAHVTTGKLDWFLAGALVVVIALVSYQQFAPVPARTAQQQAGVTAARTASAAQAGISIVVLPFENLSGDAAQEFFSDGITEEITAALAKVPDLRVVARTSAFQFKVQNRDIQSIGPQLHATHYIEGSVRKAGTRVSITAQLIKTDDGTHVWTENYDRELTDVFATQEDIATAIAGALRVPLGLKPGENLISDRSIDPESYQQYLHGKALDRGRGLQGLTEAATLLEQVVARNPGYAPAWAKLSQVYGHWAALPPVQAREDFRQFVDSVMPKADAAAQRAIQLDPNLAEGYFSLAEVQMTRSKLLAADELFSKALALDPYNPEVMGGYANMLAGVGRVKDSVAMWQRLLDVDPFVPGYNGGAAMSRWVNGQTDDAIAVLKPLQGGPVARWLAMIYASMGRYGEAADLLHAYGGAPPQIVAEAERLLRLAPAKVSFPQSLPRLEVLNFAYLYVGASSRVLDRYERLQESGYQIPFVTAWLWHPSYAPVRKTERFKAFARDSGLVEYWRAKGWPEWCHPTTGDDFECE